MRRVVVTGIGAITAVGSGRAGLWRGLLRGESGVGPITRFDASAYGSQVAGEVTDFDPGEHFPARRLKRLDRFAALSLVAAKMALEDAGNPFPNGHAPREDVGVCMGTALGGVSLAEHQHEIFLRDGIRAVNHALALLVFGGSGGSHIAIEFGLAGVGATNSNSCGSGSIAIGEAFRHIRSGRATAMLAGGAEAPLVTLTFGAFDLLRAMSRAHNHEPGRACRPFDAGRDGFVMGEGAAMLLLEERERALARGVPVYAEVLGYACNNDAYHMLAPRPDASCAARCMRLALEDAHVGTGEIDYVNAHATGTPLGDAAECLAVREVFGERARVVPVSSTKAFHAHPLGASGAIEAAICCLALANEHLPPTLNRDATDPECDLDCIPRIGRPARVEHVLSNSFGFGGINVSLVFRRHA